jgi:phosphate transport system substrate-binding protein
MSRRARLAAVGLLALWPAMACVVLTAASAQADAPTVTVTPASDLGSGQFVSVTWTGFRKYVDVEQCTASPATLDDCSAIVAQGTSVQGGGTLEISVIVGDVAAGTGTGSFPCDYQNACSIGVFNDADPLDISTAAFAAIAFGKPPSACPAPTGAQILGDGEAAANRAMNTWEVAECGAPSNLAVGYTLGDSNDARSHFIGGLDDYAVTGTPFSDDELQQLQQNGQQFGYAPLTASALVLAYNIYSYNQAQAAVGPRVTNLVLTPRQIAAIFTGQLLNWNDPFWGVGTLNPQAPGFILPANVSAIARAEHSADTWLFTGFMNATAADVWTGGVTDTFPSGGIVQDVTGANNVALAVAQPANGQFNSWGYIGFMDSSLADYYGLPTARIQFPSGDDVAATPDTIAKAIADATVNPDGTTITPDYSLTDTAAYPMPFVTYAIAPENKIDPAKGDVLRGFLDYAVHDGQSTVSNGYAPLPDDMVKETEAVIKKIPTVSDHSPSPSPSPSSSSSSSSSGLGGTGLGSGLSGALGGSSTPPSPTPSAVTTCVPAASPTPRPTPSATTTATPSPTPSPTPSARAKVKHGKKKSGPAPSPCPVTPLAAAAASTGPPVSLLPASASRMIVPLLIAFGLVALVAGPLLQMRLSGRGAGLWTRIRKARPRLRFRRRTPKPVVAEASAPTGA